jgi:predicted peptidase
VNFKHLSEIITKKSGIYLFIFVVLNSFSGICQLSSHRNEAAYPFLLNLPADSILESKPPILIFLHGRSLSGNNLDIVKRYGVINEIIRGREIPAIVIAPQVKMGKPWEPDKVLDVLQYVQSKYNTDSSRIYVAGMSLGGYGTLDFAGKYPEIVAAAVALCGGGTEKYASNLSKVPLWIEHGVNDRAVPVSESDKIVAAIQNVYDQNLLYIRNPTASHGSLERIFHSDLFYDWMFMNSKSSESEEAQFGEFCGTFSTLEDIKLD